MEILRKQWLMVMPSHCQIAIDQTDESLSMMLLSHPKSCKNIQFLLKECFARNWLFEINKHEDNPSSWMINDETVMSDGSMIIATPFDPLFIFLSHLYNAKSEKFLLPDQLIPSSPNARNIGARLLKCFENKSQMENIADVAGNGDFTAYRYNEAKTLKWLTEKVKRANTKIKDSNIFLEEQENMSPEETLLQYGCSMICDYLPDELAMTLQRHLKVKEKTTKRKNADVNSSSKKPKTEPSDDYSLLMSKTASSTGKKSLTRAQKSLNKVDKKGMKTMSSFFKTKPKNI